MERTRADQLVELKYFNSATAEAIRDSLETVWPDIPEIAGSGLTLKYLLDLNPTQHPVKTFVRDLGGGEEALKALVVDVANHPSVMARAGYDWYKSLGYGMHIVNERCDSGPFGSVLSRTTNRNRDLMYEAARLLAEPGKPLHNVLPPPIDINSLDPFTRLLPISS